MGVLGGVTWEYWGGHGNTGGDMGVQRVDMGVLGGDMGVLGSDMGVLGVTWEY